MLAVYGQPESALVSCPRSSSHFAVNVGDKQVTKNKELVSWFKGSPTMANF